MVMSSDEETLGKPATTPAQSEGEAGGSASEASNNDAEQRQKPSEARSEPSGKKPTIADRLVRYARSKAKSFHTPQNESYATIQLRTHSETWPIESSEFETWLTALFYSVESKVPYSRGVESAINTLRGLALFTGPTAEVHVRYAEHDGKIYLDLTNEKWEVVEIDSEGWRVITNPPVKFVRTPGMRRLPTPVKGGSIEELRPFLNLRKENGNGVANDRDWTLYVACLLAAMRPSGPYPVLIIQGEHGSAKSTAVRVFRELVDPAEPAHRAPPKSDRDLMVSAYNNWVVAFDNLSFLSASLSDALCRLATGGGFSARQLYTDKKEANIVAERPVLLNSITSIATRPDLLSRAVILTLQPISRETRRDESTLWGDFERVRPRILGALLDAISHGLCHLGRTRLKQMPRMADFARWVTACEGAFGWRSGTFLKAYRDHEAEKADLALSASIIAAPIRTLAASGWEGTASELLVELASTAPDEGLPDDAQSLSNELKRIEPVLRDVGVVVSRRRSHGGKRLIRLSGDAGEAGAPVESQAKSDNGDAGDGKSSVTQKGKSNGELDKEARASPASPDEKATALEVVRQLGSLIRAKASQDSGKPD